MPDRISKQKELVGKLQAEYNAKYASSTSNPPYNLKMEVEKLVGKAQPAGLLGIVAKTMSERRVVLHPDSDNESDNESDGGWGSDEEHKPMKKAPQKTQSKQDAESAVNFVKGLASCFEESKAKLEELQNAFEKSKSDAEFLAVEQQADALFESAIEQMKVAEAKPKHLRQKSKLMSEKFGFLEESFKGPRGRAMTGNNELPVVEQPVRPATTPPSEQKAPTDAAENEPKQQIGLAQLFKQRSEKLTAAPPVPVGELQRTQSEKQRLINEIEKQEDLRVAQEKERQEQERAAQEQERAAQERERQERQEQERAAQELAAQELAAQELAAQELAAQELAAQEQARVAQEQQEQLSEQEETESELTEETRPRINSALKSYRPERLPGLERRVSFGPNGTPPLVEVMPIPGKTKRSKLLPTLKGILTFNKKKTMTERVVAVKDLLVLNLSVEIDADSSELAKKDAINAIALVAKIFSGLNILLDSSDIIKEDLVDLTTIFKQPIEENENILSLFADAKVIGELKKYLLHGMNLANILKYPDYSDDVGNVEKKEKYNALKQKYNELLTQLPDLMEKTITLVDAARDVCVKFGMSVEDAGQEKPAITAPAFVSKVKAEDEEVEIAELSEKPKLTIPELIENAKHAAEMAPLMQVTATSYEVDINLAFESAKEESVHLLELISAVEHAAPQDKIELKTAIANLRTLIKALDENADGQDPNALEKFAQINQVKYNIDKQGLNDELSEAFQAAAETVEALYYMLYKRPEPVVDEAFSENIDPEEARHAEAEITETTSQIVEGRVKSKLEIETIPLKEFIFLVPRNPADLDIEKAKEAISQANKVLLLIDHEFTNNKQLLDSADQPILAACLKYREFLIELEATSLVNNRPDLVVKHKDAIDQIKRFASHDFASDSDLTIALRNVLYTYIISIPLATRLSNRRQRADARVEFNEDVEEHDGGATNSSVRVNAVIEIDPSLQEAASSVQTGIDIYEDVEARKKLLANADKLTIAKDTAAIFKLASKIPTKVATKKVDSAVENLNLIIFYALAAHEIIKDIGTISLADLNKMNGLLEKARDGELQITYEELMFLKAMLVDHKTKLVMKVAGREDLAETYNDTIDKIGAMIKQAIILDGKIKIARQLPVVTEFKEEKKEYLDAIGEKEPTHVVVDLVQKTRSDINVLLEEIDNLCGELNILKPTANLRKLLAIHGTVDMALLRKGIKQQTYEIQQMQELPFEVKSALIGAMQTAAEIKEVEVLLAIGQLNLQVRGFEDLLLDIKDDGSNDYHITESNAQHLQHLAKSVKQQNDAVLVGLMGDSNIAQVIDRAKFDKYYDLVAGTTELNVSRIGMPAVAAAVADATRRINADKKVPPALRKLFVSILETSLEIKELDTQLALFVNEHPKAEVQVGQHEQTEEQHPNFALLAQKSRQLLANITSYKDQDSQLYAIAQDSYMDLSAVADTARQENFGLLKNFSAAKQIINNDFRFDMYKDVVFRAINSKPSQILTTDELAMLERDFPDTILQVQMLKVEDIFKQSFDVIKNAQMPKELKDFLVAVLETELEVKRLKNAIKIACAQNKWLTPAKSRRNLFASSASDSQLEEKSEEPEQNENEIPQTNILGTELPKRKGTFVEPPPAASRTSFRNPRSFSGANPFEEYDETQEAVNGSFQVPPQADIDFDELRDHMANKHTRDNYLVENVAGKREFNVSIKERVGSSPVPKVTKVLTVSEGTGVGASGNPEVAKFTIPQDDVSKIQEGLKVMFADLKSFKVAKENAGGEKLEYCVPINFNPTGTATNEQIVERARCFFKAYWEVFKNAAETGLDYNLTIQPDEDTRLSLIAVLKAGIPGLDENVNTLIRHHFQDSNVAAAKLGRKPPFVATSNRNATLLLEEQKGWSILRPLTRTPTNKFDRPARS